MPIRPPWSDNLVRQVCTRMMPDEEMRSGYASAGRGQMQWRSLWPLIRILFAVRNPDIFHLCGMLEEPTAFCHLRVEPVNRTAFVGPNLLQISNGQRFCGGDRGVVSRTPYRIDIIVLRQSLQQLRDV